MGAIIVTADPQQLHNEPNQAGESHNERHHAREGQICKKCGKCFQNQKATRDYCFGCHPPDPLCSLYVKALTGRTSVVPCGHQRSVIEVKEYLVNDVGVRPEEIRLLFAGKELQNDHSMTDYKIHRDATLHMVLGCKKDELFAKSEWLDGH